MTKQDSIRSGLARARGLGSAKDGMHHWWIQRVTAVALIPLSLYWLFSLKEITNPDLAGFKQWISLPQNAITGILFVIASFYHAALGMQVVIEDYVHGKAALIASLLLNQIIFFFLGTACVCAILWLSLQSYASIG